MKILLATDGSVYSEGAAKFLTRFNFSPKDEIIVTHIISEIPYDDDHHAKIKKFIRKVAPRILEASVNILKPVRANVRSIEQDGYPDVTIIEMAKDLDAVMIVTGARGIKGVKSLFLGSVTRSVAINSPKPLLVFKRPPWETPEKMKVLFASDGSDTALATADILTSLPFPPDTELMIMNVSGASFLDIPGGLSGEINNGLKDDIAHAGAIELQDTQKVIDLHKNLLNKSFVRIHEAIKSGDPSTEILKEAEEFKADIIALGSRGLKGVKGMLGSVSRRVLGHSQCSVLIGKTEK